MIAMIMPTKPRIEPTERSILRVTMTSTMPVAITETDAAWTVRFHRLRARQEKPAGKILKAEPDDRQRPDHPDEAGYRSPVACRKRCRALRVSGARCWNGVAMVVFAIS